MRHIRVIIILSLSVLLFSCEKQQVIDENPGNRPKLTFAGFIGSGDSAHYFLVGKSMAVFGSSDLIIDTIKDAVVTLDDGSQQVEFYFDAVANAYLNPSGFFKIKQGVPVRASISWQDQVLSAISIPPVAAPYQMSVTYDSLFVNGTALFRIKMDVKNTGGKTIYLRAAGLAEDESLNSLPLFVESGSEIMALQPGKTASVILGTQANYFPNPDQKLNAIMYLLQCSPEYYQYYESLSRRSVFSSGGEANIIYSNITNGIGIFAAYTELEKRTITLR